MRNKNLSQLWIKNWAEKIHKKMGIGSEKFTILYYLYNLYYLIFLC